MRNYTTLNQIRVLYNFSGPNDPIVGSYWFFGVSADDALAQANRAAAGSFTIVEIEDLGVWYVLLDKLNIARMWNTAAFGRTIADPFFNEVGGIMGYPREPPTSDSRPVVNGKFQPSANTPRDTGWHDGNLIVRPPQGTEGGPRRRTKRDPTAELLEQIIEKLHAIQQFQAELDVRAIANRYLLGLITGEKARELAIGILEGILA